MNRKLRKSIMAVLGTAAIAGFSTQAAAQNYIDAGDLNPYGSPTNTVYTNNNSTSVFAWDGHNNNATFPFTASGWGHNVWWYTFNLTGASSVNINATPFTTASGKTINPNYNPAFTMYATTGYVNPGSGGSDGHGFDQIGTSTTLTSASYAVVNDLASAGDAVGGTLWMARDPKTSPTDDGGGVTAFVGYANSGPAGWHNSLQATPVGLGGIGAGYTGSTSGTLSATLGAGGGVADLIINNLAKGQYLLAVGGSYATQERCASVGGAYAMDATAACPSGGSTGIPTGTANGYKLTITAVQTPVPIPAAVWLFGSALAGLGVFGRRKGKSQA